MKPQIEKERDHILSKALKHVCASQAEFTISIINETAALFKPLDKKKGVKRVHTFCCERKVNLSLWLSWKGDEARTAASGG